MEIMNTKPDSQVQCASDTGSWIMPTAFGLGAGLAAAGDTALFALFQMPLLLRVALVILPVLLSMGYVCCVVGMFRRADELQRRIQLESLGFAFPATAVLVMAADLLEKAKVVPALHWGWGMLVGAMCLLWVAGYALASRRYQ
jgi:hypothetical protein